MKNVNAINSIIINIINDISNSKKISFQIACELFFKSTSYIAMMELYKKSRIIDRRNIEKLFYEEIKNLDIVSFYYIFDDIDVTNDVNQRIKEITLQIAQSNNIIYSEAYKLLINSKLYSELIDCNTLYWIKNSNILYEKYKNSENKKHSIMKYLTK